MPKTQPARTVDDYLASLPTDIRIALGKLLRQTIRAAAPNTEEVISYQIPFYKYHGMLVGFSASAKEHLTLHIISASVCATMPKRLHRSPQAREASIHS